MNQADDGMPRLLHSPASPYGAKVLMAAAHAGIPLRVERSDAIDPGAGLLAANPLGKLPVLLLPDGRTIHDSRVIVLHLDRISSGRLLPVEPEERLAAEMGEATADGLCDALMALMWERKRAPDLQDENWKARQWNRVCRVIDSGPPRQDDATLHIGHIAWRSALGYLQLRFRGSWEAERPSLVQWIAEFDEANPGLVPHLPK